ncbi:unnamed protein product [Cylicostephanus goldi]|uniref:Uncharacterized protein n=1 Tax=Cylicostephanus goldi TaxID=71465 RepID=A0A3P6UMY7_CYLGO|nr:unnamed protein product [Cylicostephanus goldi]
MAFSNGEERKRKEYREDTDVYPRYLVTPNKKYIEHSLKYFSKMFSNERYTDMLGNLSRQIYEYYFDNLEV